MVKKPRTLIATLYESEPVFRSVTQLSVEKLILIVDESMGVDQEKAYRSIIQSIGKVLKVETISVAKLDIVDVTTKVVKAIDEQVADATIFLDITAGIKTVAIGALYACFVRSDRITSITYNPDPLHGDTIISLPKIPLKLSDGQRKVLEFLEKKCNKVHSLSYSNIADNIGSSRAMLYRNIDELKKMGLVVDDEGLRITDAGKIAIL